MWIETMFPRCMLRIRGNSVIQSALVKVHACTALDVLYKTARVRVSDLISTGHGLERGRAEIQRRRSLARAVSASVVGRRNKHGLLGLCTEVNESGAPAILLF